MKNKYLYFLLLLTNLIVAQKNWKSIKYNYQVEIPKGFQIIEALGKNVDFKVGDQFGNSVVIVVKEFPPEYKNKTIKEILGSAKDNANYWEEGANEFFETPKLLKYGDTKICNYDAFWMDYTTDNGSYYYKNYCVKKGKLYFVITLTSTIKNWNYNSVIYFRFKEQMKI